MNKKVFLGGTCNNSTWREDLIPQLKIGYFNPIVKDWTPACQERELTERENSEFVLYVITPKMTGVYSIAEVVDDSNKRPDKTLFCFIQEDGGEVFETHQVKSLRAVGKIVKTNGGKVFDSLSEIAHYLNNFV